jgi:acyl-coenzyme A thioesterase PaaI-like protein
MKNALLLVSGEFKVFLVFINSHKQNTNSLSQCMRRLLCILLILVVSLFNSALSFPHKTVRFHHTQLRGKRTLHSSKPIVTKMSEFETNNVFAPSEISLPDWFTELQKDPTYELMEVKEWRDEEGRKDDGFSGIDFCHSKYASVRIMEYLIHSPELVADENMSSTTQTEFFPRLIGAAHFTPRAESHRGLCHGGSFCALMDDVIGWMGFCVSGKVKPWSGYTVQVNTSLLKSVKVNQILKLEAWVQRREGKRKHWIEAQLTNPETGDIHCKGSGLFLLAAEEVSF